MGTTRRPHTTTPVKTAQLTIPKIEGLKDLKYDQI